MRISSIEVQDAPPVKIFQIDNLSDLVVIAGANGAGKTRLILQIIRALSHPRTPGVNFTIEPTNAEERALFDGSEISSQDPTKVAKFTKLLNGTKTRRHVSSSILYFESDRTISSVQPLAFSFQIEDPDTQNIAPNVTINPLKSRWTDTQHSIFKKILTLRNELGSSAVSLGREGKEEMKIDFVDPIKPFRDAFSKLLSPKKFIDPDVQTQKLMYQDGDDTRPIETLSSGEREVVNIVFDFILREPSDCVIFFDEPELHLHPELLNRLIKTLRTIGNRNQFFLISHSPEVIASSLDDTVIFLTKPKTDGGNQATTLNQDSETTDALSALGQSVGVVALGKKIVLIEGTSSSLDTKVYSAIIQKQFPELILVPSNCRRELESFDRLNRNVLSRALWGVEFFMLADRDSSVSTNEESSNFRLLPRYHLENYFLDSDVLSSCFLGQEEEDSWLMDPIQVEARLQEIAEKKICYAASLTASHKLRHQCGNVSLMPRNVHTMSKVEMLQAASQKAATEKTRIESALDQQHVHDCFEKAYTTVESLLENGHGWKESIPAKQIFAEFCSVANIPSGKLKNLYITKALETKPEIFDDIYEILKGFSNLHTD